MLGPRSEPTRLVRIDLHDSAWHDLVANDPQALPFHHGAWAQMLAECYAFSCFGLGLKSAHGDLVSGVPVLETRGVVRGRRWISLPFTDYCPPLVGGDSDLQGRLEAEIDVARREIGVSAFELRSAPASDHALVLTGGLRHTLRLDPEPATTFRRLRSNVRRNIRSAERSKVTVARAEHEDDLTRTFYALHTATRRRHGVPVQPRRYFSLLWRRVLEQGLGFLLIARAGEHAVAAAVFLAWGSTVVYKYGASDAAASSLRPNNAIFWHAINWACENGYSMLDFGRTDSANEGLRDFKRGWGTEEIPLTYGVIGPARVSGLNPDRGARLVGPFIRRAPLFVCRGIGRALYRYAA
jgi:CelD/BcsL family acetyltransferase involved in cellulose biosynthesis